MQKSGHDFHSQLNFHGDPNVGMYGLATDKFCLVGPSQHDAKLESVLRVPLYHISLGHIDLIKFFAAGNSTHIVASSLCEAYDVNPLRAVFAKHNVRLLVVDTSYALGNLVLANDKGVVISPLLRREKREIEKFFGLPCKVSTIGGLSIVGTLGIATNKGCLLSTEVSDRELAAIEEVLGVEADIGTVGFGSPYPGAGIIANSHGFITGTTTTGPELGRIAEALGFVE